MLVEPSPKSQAYEVAGPLEVLSNSTIRGAVPESKSTKNEAEGGSRVGAGLGVTVGVIVGLVVGAGVLLGGAIVVDVGDSIAKKGVVVGAPPAGLAS